jgi:hypothetical protein
MLKQAKMNGRRTMWDYWGPEADKWLENKDLRNWKRSDYGNIEYYPSRSPSLKFFPT